MKQIDINDKQTVAYCIPTELRDEQIKINIKKVTGRLEPDEVIKQDPIAIVCFGPSLNQTWEELRNFKYIMTCSGAHKFLIEKGIVPTWHVDLEPREHKVQMLGAPHKDVEYLVASTIHPIYLDQLQGYNVKLWHIFANEEDGFRVLPRGEWAVCGGSSVGLRCMTLARFLGFMNLHIFGMDGSMVADGSHTTEHPNKPKEFFETEYNGKKYLTTPSMLFCAKETFKELDQMPNVKATFYGEGITQDMARDYVPSQKKTSEIAYNKPVLISEEFRQLNWQLHQDKPTFGMGGSRHRDTVLKLMKDMGTNSVLDYGCGKGMLAKALDVPIWEYDPAIPEKSASPKPADIVVCTDVLEHIEVDKLNFVLDDLRRCVKKVGYFVISTRKAVKTYANGANTHNIVQGKEWWDKQLRKFFDIGTIIEKEKGTELHIVVGPKTNAQFDVVTVKKDDYTFKFLTPNETTKWRANTLLTKEPSTIEWLDTIKSGEVLYDIGANIGSYSVYAGVRGAKVYSFEPEAENCSLLNKNLALNGIVTNAYCLALSDEAKLGLLFAGQTGVGGACHSFDKQIGFDLQERKAQFTQGCVGVTLDALWDSLGLPFPQHIKIDVDGLEHKVIDGGKKTLKDSRLKSLLIEINPSLGEHKQLLSKLDSLGFVYDQVQVDMATRKDGTFKGCAEYVFTREVGVKLNKFDYLLLDKVCASELQRDPFDHIFIENVFPEVVYREMIKEIGKNEYIEIEKSRGTTGYPKRFTSDMKSPFWKFVKKSLVSGKFRKALCEHFGIVDDFLPVQDVLLIRDEPGYSIPPHTDSLNKIITVLFYLPKDNSLESEGTSIFKPKKEDFVCEKGTHYNFEDFEKVKTMPFKPNSMFAFKRTNNSFHGVESCSGVRDVLLYNINHK